VNAHDCNPGPSPCDCATPPELICGDDNTCQSQI
jgi:hypothetical protein